MYIDFITGYVNITKRVNYWSWSLCQLFKELECSHNFFLCELKSVEGELGNGVLQSLGGLHLHLNFVVGHNITRFRQWGLEHRLLDLLFDWFGRWWGRWHLLWLLLWLVSQFFHNVYESLLGIDSSFVLLLIQSIKVFHHLIESMNSEIILSD